MGEHGTQQAQSYNGEVEGYSAGVLMHNSTINPWGEHDNILKRFERETCINNQPMGAGGHDHIRDPLEREAEFERVMVNLFGGTFVDRHGAPLCLSVFAATVCAGAVLLSIGVANKTWEVMYLGRFVFGLGAESLCVAQSTIVSDWFEGKGTKGVCVCLSLF